MNSKDYKFEKKKLRSRMKESLHSLGADDKSAASQQICNSIKQWLRDHPETTTVASFANLSIEPNLSSLLEQMPEINWAYPHSKPDGKMTFHKVSHLEELEPGLHGILQPKDEALTIIHPQNIDCYLCPAYAYTESGERLGKGGGYYDRLLAHRKADSTLIGVGFKLQLLDSIPTEDHDIKVDFVITE